MINQLRFSVLVLPNVPWPEFLRRCREVEALGFDSIGLADHLVDWAGNKGPWFELWTQVAAVAQATTRIRLTTLVAQNPAAQPGPLRAAGADRRSHFRWPARRWPRNRPDDRPVVPDDGHRELEREGTRRALRRICRDRRPGAVAGGDAFQGALLPGRWRGARSASRPVTAPTHHDRRDGAAHAGAYRAACRHLEQHQLRQNLRGPARGDTRPRRRARRKVRRDRPRTGDAAALLSHVRRDGAAERRQGQLLRLGRGLHADGRAGDRAWHHGDRALLPDRRRADASRATSCRR
ncbi:MAG: LLM class flavin-dependent oxidoreductase [Alphaproteobacteria bacterium]|nr:LLM class flavin-dependent oxidoreductase [Alphaproteobacteria bacterium]MCW5740373.1 LLM class flavin-dependent oxidoreductase [Alphaproteobacteria bacterium]